MVSAPAGGASEWRREGSSALETDLDRRRPSSSPSTMEVVTVMAPAGQDAPQLQTAGNRYTRGTAGGSASQGLRRDRRGRFSGRGTLFETASATVPPTRTTSAPRQPPLPRRYPRGGEGQQRRGGEGKEGGMEIREGRREGTEGRDG